MTDDGVAGDGRDPTKDRNRPDDREASERSPTASGRTNDRDPRDGPLGDLAAAVRERTGEGRAGRNGGGDRPAGRSPSESRREGPLADLASKVDERRRRPESDAFESVEVGDLDGERLWEQLAEEEADAGGPTVSPEGTSAAGETPADGRDRDVRTVPKDTCHGCPHFGDPPELSCTHEGTEILAMPDADHFRVADCPMVGGDEDIDGIGVADGAGE